jgi:hypothetical protein
VDTSAQRAYLGSFFPESLSPKLVASIPVLATSPLSCIFRYQVYFVRLNYKAQPFPTVYTKQSFTKHSFARLFSICTMPSPSQSGTAPPIVKDDRIVPMHLFDDTTANNNVLISVTLCFDKVLQPNCIHSALVRLLQIGEWRKLGGRLRRHVSLRVSKLAARITF